MGRDGRKSRRERVGTGSGSGALQLRSIYAYCAGTLYRPVWLGLFASKPNTSSKPYVTTTLQRSSSVVYLCIVTEDDHWREVVTFGFHFVIGIRIRIIHNQNQNHYGHGPIWAWHCTQLLSHTNTNNVENSPELPPVDKMRLHTHHGNSSGASQ